MAKKTETGIEEEKRNENAIGSKKENASDILVYVGPNLMSAKLSLQYATVYNSGLPEHIQQMTEEDKDLARLFVNIQDFSNASQDVEVAGSLVNIAAKNTLAKYGDRK